MMDGIQTRETPMVITLDREDALQLVALLSMSSAIIGTWFRDNEAFLDTSNRLGPIILEQLVDQTDITYHMLKARSEGLKVSTLALEDSDEND